MYRLLEESPQFAIEINQFINKRKKAAEIAKLQWGGSKNSNYTGQVSL